MADLPTHKVWLTRLCVAGVIAGFALIIVGLGWSLMATPGAVWSQEQAAELKAAYDALHDARSGIGAPRSQGIGGGEPDPRYLAAAQARLDRANAELERAQSVRDDFGRWGAASGLALTIACGLGYLASRGQ